MTRPTTSRHLTAGRMLMILGLLTAGVLASCSSEPSSRLTSATTPTSATADDGTADRAPGDESSDGADGAPRRDPLDLTTGPLIFLGAVPPMPPGADLPLPDGSADYHQLFVPGSPWTTAVGQLDAFKLHAWQVRHVIDDDQLRSIVDWLDVTDMPLMFETEPLPPPDPDECDHTESFEGPYDLEMASRIKSFGGTIEVVAIEQPFHFAHLLTGPGACQYPVERVVDEVIDYVEQMREIFPGVPVGTIEPIWQDPRTEPEDLALWLDTYEEQAGEPFAFLHIDPDWSRSDWAETARAIEDVADARGIPFGMLYNGGTETDNDRWLARTMDRIAHYETTVGGTPDHIGLQSWVDQPDRVLPDDDLGAFTSLINRYGGQRTGLSAVGDGDDVLFELIGGDGSPLADQPVTIEIRPLSGTVQTHSVAGTVPQAATNAVIAIRVHTETASTGQTDVTLESVAYRDGVDAANRVANADFGAGLTGWGTYGEPLGRATVEGEPAVLRLQADQDQVILIDSVPFPVSPGTDYEFQARLTVPPEAIGNATVAVVFLADAEVTRHTVPFAPTTVEAPALRTNAAGAAVLASAAVGGPGTYEIVGRYPGDLDRWPSSATITIAIGPEPGPGTNDAGG